MPALFAHLQSEPGPRLRSGDVATIVGTEPALVAAYANLGYLHWESRDTAFHNARLFGPTDVAAAAVLSRLFEVGLRDKEASAAASVALYGWAVEQFAQRYSPVTHALWHSDEAKPRWLFDLRRVADSSGIRWRGFTYNLDDPPAIEATRFDLRASIIIPVTPILRPIRERLIAIGEMAEGGPVLASV
jgi:hypothetical protein